MEERVEDMAGINWIRKWETRSSSICDIRRQSERSCFKIRVDKSSSANGVKVITDRLDKIFLKDEIQTTYLAYEKFEKFKRPETRSITDYIVEFERFYYKIKPDGILAYQVLQSANLSVEQQQLVRATTTELKYDIMVAQLKKIFGDCVSASAFSTEILK